MTYKNGFFKSTDGEHNIAYYVFMPKGEVKAAVQIVHGMCEYFLRYKPFAEFLAQNGIAVCGEDHLGHGSSVAHDGDYGYFSPKNGWQNVVEDMHKLTKIMKDKTGDVPYFMFGHSMGSFLARAYMIKHASALSGAVICGTGDGVPATSALLTICDAVRLAKGERFRSDKLNNAAFGKYNEHFPDRKYETAWLSRDEEVQKNYADDDKTNFIFTVNGFENLAKMLRYISDPRWFAAVRKDLPVFLIAGTQDPVGNYGKGVQAVYDKLKAQDCNVELKLYEEARHELVNEINKDEVMADVLDFFNAVINGECSTDDDYNEIDEADTESADEEQ
ncbi:MAG: alpha/beta hydrolase [Ruminococcus sp.]|nr:alpha/beta hydrolase [Ruminococcus sp.]